MVTTYRPTRKETVGVTKTMADFGSLSLGSRHLVWPFSAEIGIKSNFDSFNPHSYSLFIQKNHNIKKSNLSFASL